MESQKLGPLKPFNAVIATNHKGFRGAALVMLRGAV